MFVGFLLLSKAAFFILSHFPLFFDSRGTLHLEGCDKQINKSKPHYVPDTCGHLVFDLRYS